MKTLRLFIVDIFSLIPVFVGIVELLVQTEGDPEQVQPFSTKHPDEHPSLLKVLLSSHCSLVLTVPSPQTGPMLNLVQTDGEIPEQLHPFSTLQDEEQPSLGILFLSSHYYFPGTAYPSPHLAIHLLPDGS